VFYRAEPNSILAEGGGQADIAYELGSHGNGGSRGGVEKAKARGLLGRVNRDLAGQIAVNPPSLNGNGAAKGVGAAAARHGFLNVARSHFYANCLFIDIY
jgi:hypothetical protein